MNVIITYHTLRVRCESSEIIAPNLLEMRLGDVSADEARPTERSHQTVISNHFSRVMAGLVPAIHVFLAAPSLPSPACGRLRGRAGRGQTWIPATGAGMTTQKRFHLIGTPVGARACAHVAKDGHGRGRAAGHPSSFEILRTAAVGASGGGPEGLDPIVRYDWFRGIVPLECDHE
jgi:hypothetical protein